MIDQCEFDQNGRFAGRNVRGLVWDQMRLSDNFESNVCAP